MTTEAESIEGTLGRERQGARHGKSCLRFTRLDDLALAEQGMLLGHAVRLPVDELAKLARFWQRTVDEDGVEAVVPEEQVRV